MSRRQSHPLQAATATGADDFTRVQGIGPTIAARLLKSGILTFAQLAELSPADIATRLGGLSAKRIAREKWTSQARNLAHKKPSAHRRTSKTAGEIRQHLATFTVELLLDADNSVRRTCVTQVQTGTEAAWPGWQDECLIDFIVRQAGLSVLQHEAATPLRPTSPSHPAPYTQTTASLPSSRTETGLSGVLRLCDVTPLSLGSEIPLSGVHVGETFKVCVTLDLTEVRSSAEAILSYVVTIWAKKLRMKSRQIVGEGHGTHMPADKVQCTVEVVINAQDTYHLEALVILTEQGKESSPQRRLMAMRTSGLLQVF